MNPNYQLFKSSDVQVISKHIKYDNFSLFQNGNPFIKKKEIIISDLNVNSPIFSPNKAFFDLTNCDNYELS